MHRVRAAGFRLRSEDLAGTRPIAVTVTREGNMPMPVVKMIPLSPGKPDQTLDPPNGSGAIATVDQAKEFRFLSAFRAAVARTKGDSLRLLACSIALVICSSAYGQLDGDFVTPSENLVLDGIPGIPAKLAQDIGRYSEYRYAFQMDWHPIRREMAIGTRFGNTSQVHTVASPGGARRQVTFFTEPVNEATYHPKEGDYLLLQKDVGGGEWFQYFRLDTRSGVSTLLTDGKSRNTSARWSASGDLIAYVSTRRNGRDTDLWVMNPAEPKSDHLVAQLNGGGWKPRDWSPDDAWILVSEGISVNEKHLWLVNSVTGEKAEVLPRLPGEQVAYGNARFSKDGRGILVTTDAGSEFLRLAYIDLATRAIRFISSTLSWDVEDFAESWDGKWIAFLSNEDGFSRLHIIDSISGKERLLPTPPPGLISGLVWHRNNRDLGFSVQAGNEPVDCYSLNVASGTLDRWTRSETAVDYMAIPEARLFHWKAFDGRSLSGFLYQPPARFTGKRPVIILIHGGPEDQSRPGFLGRLNYFLNEVGVAVVLPNIRGSTGYGKTFSKLDNGLLREDSYKDIDALMDWIAIEPDLDPGRVVVQGGSYGGHMVLAISAFYSDRIRCAIDEFGPSNLVTFLENTEAYRRDLRRVEYGDERDPKMRAFLEQIAPMNHVERIRKPIFVVAGRNDPRVPVSESDQIVSALKKQGTAVRYLVAKDEGHGFQKKSNRDFEFLAEAQFLDDCMRK
jgi:dipeptidyl aminopeptidase/acylaminoacyl peptidase